MKMKDYLNVMQSILEHMDEGVHVIDKAGKTIIYNQAMEKLEKMRAEDVMKKPFKIAFKNISTKESTLLKALNKGQSTLKFRQVYLNSQSKQVSTINSTIPIYDGDVIVGAMEIANNITDIHEMSNTILELQKNIEKPEKIRNHRINTYRFHNIVGNNRVFRSVIERAMKAANTSASVFIYGETGTGKELIAQSIHFDGVRKDRPFLAQNCAAIPDALLEGILFGTAKGGFTGAIDREGLFEQANGGTLLLDEVNSMPYEIQAKLLRVLQEGYIRRVGGNKDIPVDVRIIATTNEEPEELLESGRIRKDLYYRLNIINIKLPPLRERREDILLLAEKFVNKYNEKFGKEIWMISDKMKETLKDYDYPGNVRELENIIMGAMAITDEEHVLSDKSIFLNNKKNGSKQIRTDAITEAKKYGLDVFLNNTEREILYESLIAWEWNISKAAETLGVKRQTLQHKIKKFNITK
ncbi:MAG: sigma-54 interaction domain-containing protein [Filifactoraceae bacterium]